MGKRKSERRIFMSGRCYIVGSGDFTLRDLTPGANDLVIAADGGYRYLEKASVKIDFLVGDFDSLGYVPENIVIFRFPSEKDDTDMGLAIQKGMEMGFKDFSLYAGSGTRYDHFFANLQLLARFSEKGVKIRMVTPDCNIHALSNGEIRLRREKGTVFSVFSMTDSACGLTIRNAKYALENASVSNRFPLGVSNEFSNEEAVVSIKEGVILIFEYLSPDFK